MRGDEMFAHRLKELRKEKNMTQQQLSNALLVSYQAVSAWERGQSYPDLPNAVRLARFFGISLDRLVGIQK